MLNSDLRGKSHSLAYSQIALCKLKLFSSEDAFVIYVLVEFHYFVLVEIRFDYRVGFLRRVSAARAI